jgi:hypothetical protein
MSTPIASDAVRGCPINIHKLRIVDADDSAADSLLEKRAQNAVIDSQFDIIRRLLISKRLFDTTKHKLVVEINGDKGNSFLPLHFPDTIAMYSEARDQESGSCTDASWFVQNHKHVMTSVKHLPTFSDIRDVKQKFIDTNQHRFVDDGPGGIDRGYARPHLQSVPEEGGSCNLILEAELAVPVVLHESTRIRFVVQGFHGTTGRSTCTDWLSGRELVDQASGVFEMRKKCLAELKQELQLGSCKVHPHPLLSSGVVFSNLNSGKDSCREFYEDKPMHFRDDSHALLTQFSMFWTRHNSSKNKRALAIGSASVAIKFTRPRAEDSNDTFPECAACFDTILQPEWQCKGCGKHMHNECIATWKVTCKRNGVGASCPLCRVQI